MKVSSPNDVPIYTIASSSITALPDWLARKRKKELRHDPNFSQRIELIQDFEFPEASLNLRQTRDSKYIIATGTYKPHFRVFELAEASMKFDRHTDCETLTFQILSDDYRKLALLQADRSIELHTAQGLHFRTRIPRFGRDLVYHPYTCDLLVASAGKDVYRLNLEEGRFMKPIESLSDGSNCVSVCSAHHMWGLGGEDSCVEFYDHRDRKRIGRNSMARYVSSTSVFPEVTALTFNDDGLTYGVGTKSGQVLLFDLRSPKPMQVKSHQYETPIKKITFLADDRVLTADTKIIKIWDKNSGKLFTSVEPENEINDVLIDSGLIMTANEGSRMNIFFIPSLGPAPKWCTFLDSLTEELEETKQASTWDDYKFVSRKDLAHLGLEHLIGTNLLKAYMHGYFVDLRLYEKARAIANPFAYEEHKTRIAREKLEQERASRISAVRKLPKVNRHAAERLMASKKKADEIAEEASAKNPLGDTRFGDMFTNPDFQIDENDPEFIRYHPSVKQKPAIDEFSEVSEKEESEIEGQVSDGDESVFGGSDASDELVSRRRGNDDRKEKQKSRKQRFFESSKTWDKIQKDSASPVKNMTFGSRMKTGQHDRQANVTHRSSGAMSMSYKATSARGGRGGHGGRGRGRGGKRQ